MRFAPKGPIALPEAEPAMVGGVGVRTQQRDEGVADLGRKLAAHGREFIELVLIFGTESGYLGEGDVWR
jgi:hypothetical protein